MKAGVESTTSCELLAGAADLQLGLLALGDVLAGAEHVHGLAVGPRVRSGASVDAPARSRRGARCDTPARTVRLLAGCGAARAVNARAVVGVHVRVEPRQAGRRCRASYPKMRYVSLDQSELPGTSFRPSRRRSPPSSPPARPPPPAPASARSAAGRVSTPFISLMSDDQHHEAAHPSAVVAVGNVGRPQTSRRAGLEDGGVVEGDLLAGERPLDVRSNVAPRRGVEHLARLPPHDLPRRGRPNQRP